MNSFFIFFTLIGSQSVFAGYLYDKGLGTECLYDEDCITRNSFCKGNKICACKIGYQYDPGSDVCFPKEVGLKCNEDYDCSALQNAKCNNGKCQCKYDYVPAKERGACLPSMRLTSICEEDSQCNSVMNRSFCDPVIRQCVCERGLRRDNYRMMCVEQQKLHTRCRTTQECEVSEELYGKVECKTVGSGFFATCECAEGYEERDDGCYKGGSSRAILSFYTIIQFVIVKWLI